MKLERINENQIRCTLNMDDLRNRQLRMSELAYGSEKARALFREMMLQASDELGFEAEDTPLMIEAIPISPECLVLQITKVDDPDELDTRFSNFSPGGAEELETEEATMEESSYADEILSCYAQLENLIKAQKEQLTERTPTRKSKAASPSQSSSVLQSKTKTEEPQPSLAKIFVFRNLDLITEAAKLVVGFYNGDNTLYKNPANGNYYLIASMSAHTPQVFNKVCNLIGEYAQTERVNYASGLYYAEHYEPILKSNALQQLARL